MGNIMSYMFREKNIYNPLELVCYSCKYLYTVERSDTPKCPWCQSIMAYRSTCDRCKKSFWSRYNRKNKCRDCQKYTNCIICEREIINCEKCNECRTIVQICNHCDDEIKDKPIILYNKTYHDECYENIMRIDPETYDNKEIVITYDAVTTEHDGYCSDPYDEEIITNKIKLKYPLSKTFTDDDYDPIIKKVNLNNPKLSVYVKESDGCDLGSGYCGLGTTYTIVKAKIIDL